MCGHDNRRIANRQHIVLSCSHAAGAACRFIDCYRMAPLTPDQTQAMGLAFEEALAALGMTDRTDPLVEIVAKKIIELGRQGVRDTRQLRDLTIKAFT